MDAKITIQGQLCAGYGVTVELPLEFCKRFDKTAYVYVDGTVLHCYWGHSAPTDSSIRRSVTHYSELTTARNGVQRRGKEILEALDMANEPSIQETVVIPLR